MYSEKVLLNLVPMIYEGVAHYERWPAFLEQYQEILSARNIVLAYAGAGKARSLIVATGADQTDIGKYYQYSCPWLDRLMAANCQTGGADASHHLITDRELESTPCFSEFLGPRRFHYGLGAAIPVNGPDPALLVILREKSKGPFDDEDLHFLRALVPHMSQAFRLYGRVAALEEERRCLADSLDRMSTGLIVLDPRGRALFVNREARQVVQQKDGLQLSPDGLTASYSHETDALRRLVNGAAITTNGNGYSQGGEILLSRPSMKRPLAVSVSPLPKDGLFPGLPGSPAVAVFISDPEAALESDESLLQRLYRLTPAESRLTAALLSGDDLREVAESMGVSYHTARTQIKSVFDKTGTRRQAELVRLLLKLPARPAVPGFSNRKNENPSGHHPNGR